ncbi:MAG TPA: hypothetical protein VMH86_16680 [Rhizomicrobium sp.]|nr:hypothetical protein [Rhizomicrobium sp.]
MTDLPGLGGLAVMEEFRRNGIREPALIVADRELPADRSVNVNVLDILPRPANLRALSWLECICAAHVALNRRMRRAAWPICEVRLS